jgi:hypothetical protein
MKMKILCINTPQARKQKQVLQKEVENVLFNKAVES